MQEDLAKLREKLTVQDVSAPACFHALPLCTAHAISPALCAIFLNMLWVLHRTSSLLSEHGT